MVVTVGADSRAGELTAVSVVVPPGVTLCLEGRGQQGTGASRDKQHPLNRAPGRGQGSSPRCMHLRIRTAGPSSRRPTGRTEEEQVLDRASWKAPGEVEGFTVYRTRRYPFYFFFLFLVKCVFIPHCKFPIFFFSTLATMFYYIFIFKFLPF